MEYVGGLANVQLGRATRYCNKDCQLADFTRVHRRECETFVHLPTTMAFLSTAENEQQFPPHPIFARSHQEHVGCWVSIDGRIDGSYVDRTSLREGSNRINV